jgi:two-component system CheB/CheR fusion protein
MLDNDFNIRQFTPVAKTLLNLIDTDVGRPFSDIRPNLNIPDLDRLILKVIDTMTLKSLEVQDPRGHWYTLYIRPYKTVDNRVAGAVLVFVEMTQLLATVVRDSNDAITVQDFDGRILAWNRSAEALYGYTETEALSLNVSALIPESTRAEAQQLLERLRRGDTIKSFETQRLTKEGRLINVSLTLSALRDEKGNVTALATTERALTP